MVLVAFSLNLTMLLEGQGGKPKVFPPYSLKALWDLHLLCFACTLGSTRTSHPIRYLSIETHFEEDFVSIFGHVGQIGSQGCSRWGKGGIPKVVPPLLP